MIDDATSQWLERFVPSDSKAENMGVLELYLNKHGRPGAFYTDKAGLFQTAVKTKRDEQREGKDREQMPPTQIARALQELDIVWIADEPIPSPPATQSLRIWPLHYYSREKYAALGKIACPTLCGLAFR